MRVLVTGGAGYVGTRLANALSRAGHNVRVLDALLFGNCGLRPDIELRRGDICLRSDAARAMSGIDAVYHLAAVGAAASDERNEGIARYVNVEGTRTLLREAQHARVNRFIFASTTRATRNQEATQQLQDIYAQTKLEAEELVLEANRPGFATVVIRKALICGPSPRQRFDLGVNALVGSAFCDSTMLVPSDAQRQPHLTMSDAVRLYLTLLDVRSDLVAGEVFDAGWEDQTLLELAPMIGEWVSTSSGRRPVLEIGEQTASTRDIQVDPSKLERVLGFRPQYTVRDMVSQLAQLMELGFLDRYDRDIYHNDRVGWRTTTMLKRPRVRDLLQRVSQPFHSRV